MESIKVLRRQGLQTKEVMVGDQILVSLTEIGNFTATAHKITDKAILFIFDEYIVSRPMNKQRTNKGGYEESDLKVWIDTVLLKAFPEKLKSRIVELSIPTVGEVFGHDDKWGNVRFELDEDEQLPLMKERRNRVAYLNNEWKWGWLRNATKKDVSVALFAVVNACGSADYNFASEPLGIRPKFWLVR